MPGGPMTASAPTAPAPSPSAAPGSSTHWHQPGALQNPRPTSVQDLHIRVVGAATGEFLHEFTLDPDRNYQPPAHPRDAPQPGPNDQDPEPSCGFGVIPMS